jgi:hypothetical protein
MNVLALDTGSPVGKLELPIDASLIRKPQPKVHAPVVRATPRESLPGTFSIPSDAELLAIRDAAMAAEVAVISAEEALERARETAAKMKELLIRKEDAAQQAVRQLGSAR